MIRIMQRSEEGTAVLTTTNMDDYSFRGRKFQLNKVVTVPVGGLKIALDPTACDEVIFAPPTYVAGSGQHTVVMYTTDVVPTGGTQLFGHCTHHKINTTPKLVILSAAKGS